MSLSLRETPNTSWNKSFICMLINKKKERKKKLLKGRKVMNQEILFAYYQKVKRKNFVSWNVLNLFQIRASLGFKLLNRRFYRRNFLFFPINRFIRNFVFSWFIYFSTVTLTREFFFMSFPSWGFRRMNKWLNEYRCFCAFFFLLP